MSSADAYLEAWRARARAAEELASTWRAERHAEARRVARTLVERFGATRVILFGSLATGSAAPGSDVDLWVEGLAEGAFVDALNVAREGISSAEVDLVLAEHARAAVRERALSDGVVLHGG